MAKSRVVAFGVFDGLHPGHIHFLEQARRLGTELIVVVTRDVVATKEKRAPRIAERDRVRLVAALRVVDRAILGDPPDRYGSVLRRFRPNIVALGYDQRYDPDALRKHLDAANCVHTIVQRLRAYRGNQYHSKLLQSA